MDRIISDFLKKYSTSTTRHILGVSGGVDSMVLLAILQELKISVIAVHYNFMLRETDADLDQKLVEEFCRKNNIPCFIRKENAQQFADENKIGIQEAAREMRYAFFREVMQKEDASKIVTAHHADDQVETILFNLLRASGIKGLAGMPAAENDILRPLISVTKEEIYQYAKKNNIPFREDVSNASDKYQRNFLRNQIIPQLQERFPNANENILKSADLLKETHTIYEQQIEQIQGKLIEKMDDSTDRLPIRKLRHYQPQHTILFELFKVYGLEQTQLSELVKLLTAENGSRLELKNYTVYRDRNFLLIQRNEGEQETTVFLEKEKGSVQLKQGNLSWELINEPIDSVRFDKNIATLDATDIQLPFMVRRPKEGDYFYPLGMKKKKKLSRYFIDNKYSPLDKEQALLLEMVPSNGSGKKRIMWLIGERIDNRFRISEKTMAYFKFTFKPS